MANQADQIQQAVCATIRAEVADLRAFVDRRIAELSVEVHAAVQIVDFSETNLTLQLKTIREQIAGVVAPPAAATRNSGLELEAVVQATEAAANRIMEAAEAIADWLRDEGGDSVSAQALTAKVSAIFEACTFQDVTGQRIRRAIHHLRHVETMLTTMAPAALGRQLAEGGLAQQGSEQGEPPGPAGPDLSQDAVDTMFG